MTLIADINTITGALEVSGVKRVYTMADLKKGVSKPDLPAIVPVIRTGTFNRVAFGAVDGSYNDQHTIILRLLERPAQPGIQGEALAAIAGYVHAIRQALDETRSERADLDAARIERFDLDRIGVVRHPGHGEAGILNLMQSHQARKVIQIDRDTV